MNFFVNNQQKQTYYFLHFSSVRKKIEKKLAKSQFDVKIIIFYVKKEPEHRSGRN